MSRGGGPSDEVRSDKRSVLVSSSFSEPSIESSDVLEPSSALMSESESAPI